MGCNCTKITAQAGRTYYVEPGGALREITGFTPRAHAGGLASSLTVPMIAFGVLGGGLAKLTGASWLLAGGIAVAAPIAVVVALGLAARAA